MTDTWHAPDDLLARFATSPDSVDGITAASIEQHLLHCDRCRRAVAANDPADLDLLWEEIADRIDQRRRPTLIERALHMFRLDSGLARLVAATPSLRLQGLFATVLVSVGAALLARSAESDGPFLAVAPLVVLGVVALSFAPGTDPAGEAAAATPLHGWGLFARRAAVVLTLAFVSLGLATALLPTTDRTALAWIAPALALALVALALGTRFAPVPTALMLGTAWIGLVAAVHVMNRGTPLTATFLFDVSGQTAAFAVALLGAAVLYLRRDELDQRLLSAESDLGRYL